MKGEDYADAENVMISEFDPTKNQFNIVKGRAIQKIDDSRDDENLGLTSKGIHEIFR